MARGFRYVALVTTASMTGALLIAPTAPAGAAAATPTEVAVIPESEPTVRPQENLYVAGRTGFLHRRNGGPDYLWTRYDTGQSRVVAELAGVNFSLIRSAGDDAVAVLGQLPARPAPGTVSRLDLATGALEQWTVPSGTAAHGIFGRSMLIRRWTGSAYALEVHTVDPAGGTSVAPVSGLPAGATTTTARVGDAASAIVPFVAGGTSRYGLLDLATAALTEIPQPDPALTPTWLLTGDSVVRIHTLDGTLRVWSRKGLRDGTGTAARTLTVPVGTQRAVLVGGHVLAAAVDTRSTEFPAYTLPIAGGDLTRVVPKVAWEPGAIIQGPDDTALVVGGSGPSDWTVHRFAVGPDGAPVGQPVMDVRDPVEHAGLTYRQGFVRHLQTQLSPTNGAVQYALYNHAVLPDDGSGGGLTTRPAGGTLPAGTVPCASGVHCVHLVDGTSGGVTYLSAGANGTTEVRTRIDAYTSTRLAILPTSGGRLVDAGAQYVVVNGGSPATQYVVDLDQQTVVRTGPITGASLWFDTLWTAGTTAGQITATKLADGTTGQTVSTGTACVPTELQATARWLYWSCATTGAAGVYDLQRKVNIAVPAGPALLGDGFLVRHDRAAGALEMSDFHAGTVQPAIRLADLPAGPVSDEREVTWAVDRHTGGVAYVDRDNAVHVLDTGVPGTAPAVAVGYFHDWSYPRATDWQTNWTANLRLTRPVSSWQVTITRGTTGEVVDTRSGGPVRAGVFTSWNGRLSNGKPAENGIYRWTLTAPVPGGGVGTVGTGTLRVACGTFPFHTYDCYNGPALLGVKSNGEGYWYNGSYDPALKGRLFNNGHTEGWCVSCSGTARITAIVPFGDFDGDGMPDLITRDGAGVLHAYLGIGQTYFNTDVVRHIRMGSGWQAYASIVAPGDLNRDGFDDLVAADTSGGLWLYTATGRGAFRARVKIGTGWTIYGRLIGVGDLDGDGNGDLLGVDKSGGLYRYSGNGRGGLGSRVKIGTGWTIYNAIVPIGDFTQDGRNDIVARDASGVLWLYAGRGDGWFGGRVKAGTGWNTFKVIA